MLPQVGECLSLALEALQYLTRVSAMAMCLAMRITMYFTLQDMLKRKADVFESPWGPENIREQLERKSQERSLAAKAGLIRPFLLMVSMHPSLRNRIGMKGTCPVRRSRGEVKQNWCSILVQKGRLAPAKRGKHASFLFCQA